MKKYNCSICGAGCYSADTTKTICAECEKDGNLVEVVRCKDCDHQEVCHLQARLEFCSDGERRAKE